MNRIESARIARMVSLVAAVVLPGCVIESSGGPDPVVQGRGCPALEASGSTVLVSLSAQRGYYVSLESYAFPGYYVRHEDGFGVISAIETGTDRADATFRIVPGLSDSRCISFESRNYPGSYLRQQNGDVLLSAWRSDSIFQEDATFCPRPGLADYDEISFESCNNPGMYLNQYEDGLYIDGGDSGEFEEDATFVIDSPWAP